MKGLKMTRQKSKHVAQETIIIIIIIIIIIMFMKV